MRSDLSDAPSPDLPSAASNSSTLSSGRRERRTVSSASPAAHHLHFASDVFPSPSSAPYALHPSGSQSTGRRTPQPHLPPQRRASRPISADPLLSPRERRASLATSAAYTTAPSSVTARRASMARLRNGRPIKKEDAEVWEFGENTANPGLIASTSSRKGVNHSEEEQLQQRLARLDMDLVMQALQEQSTPPRPEFGLSTSSSAPMGTPPGLSGTRRSSSYATNSPPLRLEDLRLHPAGSPDSRGENGKERRKLKNILSVSRKGKERESLTPAEEEERLRAEESQRIERIRHIHSTLTQSTLSRADSARLQFEARYVYLLSEPPQRGRRPPTFVDVVKWKRSVRDIGRLKRRHESRVALSRGQSLTRVATNDSAGDPVLKSIGSSPTNPDSRRGSFNVSHAQSSIPQSFSTDTASQWAEQLILSKHRRKRSILSGSTTALTWDSAGMPGKSSDWDFTAQDIMEYLACQGEVEQFVPPTEQEHEVRSSEERESIELEKLLRRTVSGTSRPDKSAPASVLSITSATDDSAVEGIASPVRGRLPVHLNVVPPTTGKRQLSLVTEDEPESPTDMPSKRRRGHLLSTPESPVSIREEHASVQAPKFRRTHSMGVGRGGSISQAFGNLLNLSGSAAGSQEAFGPPSGVASSRQSLTGKMWAANRVRQSLDETRDKSPDGSASEHLLSAVNSDNDNASGGDLPWKRNGPRTKKKRKIPSITFNRRGLAAEAEKGPDESVLSLPTPGPRQKLTPMMLPNVPGFEKEDEEPDDSVDSEEEAAEYERKSRLLDNVRLQVSRMDNILASSRIKHLAQELMDMRVQTLTMHTGAPVILPPLPRDLPLPTGASHPDTSDLRRVYPEPLRPLEHHNVSDLRGALPRTISLPLPDPEDDDSPGHGRAMTVSRSASLPQGDGADADLVPHIQDALSHLATLWKEVDTRLDSLFTLQQAAFQTHARMQMAVEAAQAQFFDELQVMDRLDDRIHRLKTRNVGNSWLFTFLAGLAEVLLFFVWLIAKIIQLVVFRIPKLAWKAVVKLFVFLWWLIRWLLFLDYLWP
ncbi:hypothetical protein CALCODRAFT_555117 [Calocera cornea HHB12733]|uniref:Uncharacterized protein n=1 Tax=Calocera cornea HHB12733 TaxID=1353952 RepID=A0A165GB77_9BASI|nr:hypothetical protein CALCODRAFT_555117 [Calocera cornea HHB12733]